MRHIARAPENLSVRPTSRPGGARDFKTTRDDFPLAENIVWTEQASPRLLRGTQTPAATSPIIHPTRLHNVSVWKPGEEFQVLWPALASPHRLVAESHDGSFGINAIILPLDDAFETRLDAARRFWRELNGRPHGPAYGALPQQTKARHILNLRAHDARRAGATYREVAEVLLSREPIAPRDWRDHHLRHKVRAILRRADRLVAGGYRDLLFYPHSRSRKSDR